MGRILFRNRLDPDNMFVPSAVTFTELTPESTRPAQTSWTEPKYDPISGKILWQGADRSSTTIYASEVFWLTTGTGAWTQHPHGNQTPDNDCSDLVGYERSIAVDGYDWPKDRHPEQTTIDTAGDYLWMWGGVKCNENQANLWRLALAPNPTDAVWTKVSVTTVPDVLNSGAMTYDSDLNALVLWGSASGFPRLYLFPLDVSLTANQITAGCATARDWTRIETVDDVYPPGVRFSSLWYDRFTQRTLQFGGETGGGTSKAELWAYNALAQQFTQKASGPPAHVLSGTNTGKPSAAFDPDRGILYHAQLSGTGAPKMWAYITRTDTWVELSSATVPVPQDPVTMFPMEWDRTASKLVAFVYGDFQTFVGTVS